MLESLVRRLLKVSTVSAIFFAVAAHAQVPGLPTIDFERYFPHIVAVSEEATDDAFPHGVQYKFFSVRDEKDHVVVVTLTRREGSDRVVRVFSAKGPIDGSEKTLRDTVDRFSKSVNMRFEVIDLRDIKTFADFTDRATALGWALQSIPK